MKLQKLDNLLLNLFVVFDARRIKGVTLLRAAEAAKQLVIRVRRGKISALILIMAVASGPAGPVLARPVFTVLLELRIRR